MGTGFSRPWRRTCHQCAKTSPSASGGSTQSCITNLTRALTQPCTLPRDLDAVPPFVPPIKEGVVTKLCNACTMLVVAHLDLPHVTTYYTFRIRLAEIVTPRDDPTSSAEEREFAQKVQHRLHDRLHHQTVQLGIVPRCTDGHGNLLCDVHHDGLHINQWLVDEHFAVPLHAASSVAVLRKKFDWQAHRDACPQQFRRIHVLASDEIETVAI